jgi:hypothetical protein
MNQPLKPAVYRIDGKKAFVDIQTFEIYWMPITIEIGIHALDGDIAFVKEVDRQNA